MFILGTAQNADLSSAKVAKKLIKNAKIKGVTWLECKNLVTLESLNCGVIPLRVVFIKKLLNDMNDKKIIMQSENFSK